MAIEKVRIRFEGKTLECRPDTTVAVALWENGIRHLSHSPKYGRPRGVTCARGHCTACLMRVDEVPNVRVCELAVRAGMEISRQDAGAFYAVPMQKVLAAGDALFPVGFYYKWFTRPPFLSRMFLEGIRPLTGVGRLPGRTGALRALPAGRQPSAAPGPEPADLGPFDTLVIGAGPSGLQAAAEAAGRTLIIDDHPEPGGQRRAALQMVATKRPDLMEAFPFLRAALERINAGRDRLAASGHVEFHGGTRAIAGYYPDGVLLRKDGALKTARFSRMIWAAGALDTLGLFPGNDTAGALGPRALYRLLARDGLDVHSRQTLVIGSGFDFWLSAALLATAGALPGLVVTRDDKLAGVPAAVDLGWQLTTGMSLDRIVGNRDLGLVATFGPDRPRKSTGVAQMAMEAELAVICNRGKPAYDVPYQLGVDLVNQPDRGGFIMPRSGDSDSDPATCRLPGGAVVTALGEAAGRMPGPAILQPGKVTGP